MLEKLEKHARKGVSQVEEWRNWIMMNLDFARRPRRVPEKILFLSELPKGITGKLQRRVLKQMVNPPTDGQTAASTE